MLRGTRRRVIQAKLKGWYDTVRPTFPDPSAYAGFPEDMDYWSCAQWEEYYKRMASISGANEARLFWNTDSDQIGFWADGRSCRYDCNWNRRMLKLDLNTGSNVFSNAYCSLANVTEGVAQVTNPKMVKGVITVALIAGSIYAADKLGIIDSIKKARK